MNRFLRAIARELGSALIAALNNGWRPSTLVSERLAGCMVKSIRHLRDWPFTFSRAELVFIPADGSIGLRAPAGAIFALNEPARRRASTAPTNRAWRPLGDALGCEALASDWADLLIQRAGRRPQ